MSALAARPTSLALAEPVPPEVPVGASVALKAIVSCAAASDLRGAHVNVVCSDAVVATRELTEFRDGFNETDTFAVTAPARLGAFTWTLVFPRQEIGGIAYEESALAVTLATRPHRTSLAVWAVPSPVAIGERFRIAVGARSSGGCDLTGAKVAILDERGTTIGEGSLGDAPWPGTDALYWCEIGLAAPPQAGTVSWSAAIAAADLALPHAGASTAWGFTAVNRPEHRLTVKVVADGTPVENVQVALGPYRAATDAAGTAVIETPAGRYDLAAWHAEFEAFATPVEIAQDGAVEVALTRLPEEIKAWG